MKMRFQELLWVTVATCATVEAVSIPPTYAIHEKRDVHPAKWTKRNKVRSETLLSMRIGLKQRNLDQGHDLLMDVSHPDSPNYSKHWTSEQVIEMFAPADDTVTAVLEWLVSFGISKNRITHTDNKQWLAFDATTEEAESLLHTQYHEYEHVPSGHVTVACENYHVPKKIQEHIDYIAPGIKLFAPNKIDRRGMGMTNSGGPKPPLRVPWPNPLTLLKELATCDIAITPICIAALYGVPPGNKANPSNAMGIFESGDYYSQEDLNLFFANFTPYIPQDTHPKLDSIDGGLAPVAVNSAGVESDLDFELAYPILWPQNTVLYQTDDFNYATGVIPYPGGFNTFLDALDGSYCTYCAFGECGDDSNDPVYPDNLPNGYTGQLQCGVYTPTNVISVSYGGQEDDLPAYYQQRQCNEFMKLGLQGHSILFASGDDGVAGPPGDGSSNGCLGGDENTPGKIFSPAWPNSCPYLTNVGATKVYPGHTVFQPESAVVDPIGHPYKSAYSSGGGFSNIYPVPSYQKAALDTYFRDHNPPYPYYSGNASIGANGGLYNRIGRGYPDVAANGDNIATFAKGKFALHGGTSASTPIFSSIINRINEERLALGKRTVGFINPTLYSNPWVLNDITNGSNPGCGTDGFYAVKGWDPVTGLGTPNFPRMLALWLLLP